MSKVVLAGQAARVQPGGSRGRRGGRGGITRHRLKLTGDAMTTQYLKREALAIVAKRDSGRMPASTASAMLSLIQAECSQLLEIGRAKARGEPVPDFKVPGTPGRPRLLKTKQPRRNPNPRPYNWKTWPPAHLVRKYPERYAHVVGAENAMVELLRDGKAS
jgi:hypothetical protein